MNAGFGLLMAAALLAGSPALGDGAFTLASRSVNDGAVLDVRHAGNLPTNPNCPGRNISPELDWSNPPPGTLSLAIVMTDPEARYGFGITHWVAYGIPASRMSLAEGAASGPPEGFVGGKNMMGLDHYVGPCTPPNMSWHHYTFVAIATDLAPDALPAGLTREELMARLEGHAKGSAGLVVRFRHR